MKEKIAEQKAQIKEKIAQFKTKVHDKKVQTEQELAEAEKIWLEELNGIGPYWGYYIY